AVVVNEGGYGFYRVRYAPELLERVVRHLPDLAPIERFNLVNDAWAVAVAGLGSLTDYLDLTARFRGERDRNVWSVLIASFPALIAILAHAGDAARYDEFVRRFRAATTPQEEQRYLYALAGFRQPDLLTQTLAHALNGEIRTQDAPFVVRALLTNVHARELAWDFVKTNWDAMDRQYPKHGLRRLAEGVIALATPELERDVHAFVRARKIDFGGKTLAQY